MINKKTIILPIVFLMAIVISNPMQLVTAQENQTETQMKHSESLKRAIEDIKNDHPNAKELEELLVADPNTLVEKLSAMDSQEAVHILLTIETLEKLNDLLASQLLEEQK